MPFSPDRLHPVEKQALLLHLIFTGICLLVLFLPTGPAVGPRLLFLVILYIVIPEIILGLTAFFAFQQVKTKPIRYKIIAAFLVMQLYLGSAAFFYFLIEGILLGK